MSPSFHSAVAELLLELNTSNDVLQSVIDACQYQLGFRLCAFVQRTEDTPNNFEISKLYDIDNRGKLTSQLQNDRSLMQLIDHTERTQNSESMRSGEDYWLAIPAGPAGIFVGLCTSDVSDEFTTYIARIIAHAIHTLTNDQQRTLLAEENKRLILATKAGRIGTWELDTITGELHWDEQMFCLYDVDQCSFTNDYEFFKSMLHPDDAPELLKFLENYTSQKKTESVDFQFRIITPSGEVRKLAGYATLIAKPTNRLQMVGVNYDVTELETARTQSIYRSKLESLLIDISMKVIRSEAEELDQVTNEALAVIGNFVGADRAYLFEYDFKKNTCDNTHEWCNDDIEPEIDNLQCVSLDDIDIWVTSHKAGLPMFVRRVQDLPENHGLRVILEPQGIRSLITIPLMEGNNCKGFIGFDSVRQERHWNDVDISLLKLLAELLVNAKMKATNDLLIKQTQQELIQSRDTARFLAKEASAASVAKSRFVASVSHEIRTPLHAILGIADLASQRTEDPKLAEDISTIRNAGNTLLELINDVLDFSKAEANELSIKSEEFSIVELINTLQRLFRPLAKRKEIAFDCHIQPGIPDILVGDELRIRQILSNLLSNAIKFTQLGGVTLRVTLNNQRNGGRQLTDSVALCFEVSDTGSGIAAHDMDRIFDPFFQSDESKRDQLGGTGLGLPISKLIAQKMKGTITVNSVKHQGSSFKFNLILKIGSTSCTTASVISSEVDETKLSGYRLLLAEDNPINQQLIRAYLSKSGCQIDIVGDGEQVLESYVRSRYHLILMDCQMPKLDGFDTTKVIRLQESADSRLPIIAVTASAMESDRETCLQAGMDDVLTKPFTKNQLINLIIKHLKINSY